MINNKYSRQDFSEKKFLDIDPSEFNNTTIIGSNFAQEFFLDVEVFPNITGVTFENCNLDNVKIPDNNILVNSSNRRLQVQNDGNIWELSNDNKPVNCITVDYDDNGNRITYTVDDIPAVYELERRINEFQWLSEFGGDEPEDWSYYKDMPTKVETTTKFMTITLDKAFERQLRTLPRFQNFVNKFEVLKSNGKVIVQGNMDMYTIRGRAYRFKDQNGVRYE